MCNTLEQVNNSKEVKEPTDTNQNDNENKIIDTLNQSTDLFPQLESSNTDRLKEYEDKILKADAIPCASKYPSGNLSNLVTVKKKGRIIFTFDLLKTALISNSCYCKSVRHSRYC